jgi:hypothetical protein
VTRNSLPGAFGAINKWRDRNVYFKHSDVTGCLAGSIRINGIVARRMGDNGSATGKKGGQKEPRPIKRGRPARLEWGTFY